MLLLFACEAQEPIPLTPAEKAGQDIVSTHLDLDLTALTGHATLTATPATGADTVTLDVRGLTLSAVTVDGTAVATDAPGGLLTVRAPSTVTVQVDYHFPTRTEAQFDGWMPDLGVTFLWPYHCGNLYPCDPGLTDTTAVSMNVTGVPDGLTAIYAANPTGEGPAYMPGIAVGDYTELPLGQTTAGTTLSVYTRAQGPGEDAARAGTAHLVSAFDFFETRYGPYNFGPTYASVEVDWGADSWGGMEHHPYSHIATFDLDDEEVHVHEAGHGWYGDGVRIACWEDFVLSEGTTTYITARAMDELDGPDLWPYYVDDFLTPICNGNDVNTVVMPEGCGQLDMMKSDLWSLAPYMKGACFYEEVADRVGADTLDTAIASFYQEHVGQTGTMRDMIARIKEQADPKDEAAIDSAVQDWLLTEACPSDYANRCRFHGN